MIGALGLAAIGAAVLAAVCWWGLDSLRNWP